MENRNERRDTPMRNCEECQRVLNIDEFPRKKRNTQFLDDPRLYYPRIFTCSDCLRTKHQKESNLKLNEDPTLESAMQKAMKRRLYDCLTRSEHRSLNESNQEAITFQLIQEEYFKQNGNCSRCGVKMTTGTSENGYALCMEDRENTGKITDYTFTLTIDRTNAGNPRAPYVDGKTGEINFTLVCLKCNRDKFFQEDKLGKLEHRNKEQNQIIINLKENMNALTEAVLSTMFSSNPFDNDDNNNAQISKRGQESLIWSLQSENKRLKQQIFTYQQILQPSKNKSTPNSNNQDQNNETVQSELIVDRENFTDNSLIEKKKKTQRRKKISQKQSPTKGPLVIESPKTLVPPATPPLTKIITLERNSENGSLVTKCSYCTGPPPPGSITIDSNGIGSCNY
jgi:hypothetical protein